MAVREGFDLRAFPLSSEGRDASMIGGLVTAHCD